MLLRCPRPVTTSRSGRVRPRHATSPSPPFAPSASAPPLSPELLAACAVLRATPDLYAADADTERAVDALTASGPPPPLAAVLPLSDGVWRVRYAPHIKAGSLFGLRFSPLEYVISSNGTKMTSNVRYQTALGAGWLCTEGGVGPAAAARGGDGGGEGFAVTRDTSILFHSFWAGGDDSGPPRGPGSSAAAAAINALGKLGFVSSLSIFPLLFFSASEGVCVFSFPPLRAKIAAVRETQQLLPAARA